MLAATKSPRGWLAGLPAGAGVVTDEGRWSPARQARTSWLGDSPRTGRVITPSRATSGALPAASKTMPRPSTSAS